MINKKMTGPGHSGKGNLEYLILLFAGDGKKPGFTVKVSPDCLTYVHMNIK